ncbi:protein of unknown function UPF0227 [Crinalium epipsammum PCC 9333]|uniref:Esterase n=1 Tax=Crinalium epipsammum PCC 9333 TaxID=1173022 RepID=K9W751_9CYAN|nr:YqiA/YcfP family alpha/beta fold hydrolase [Crinalium epipsammum]AFZ15300.1 protein of unknown function UPF0227 [Crinalium epipsammum PCC 9333]
MTRTNYIYLHGFASSPNSSKAQYLCDRFSALNIPLKIPDFNQGGFSDITITRQIEQVKAEIQPDNTSVTLIGSSLGGLTAAWLGENYPQVQKLVLLAPAFNFLSHWLTKLGEAELQRWQKEQYLSVYHYGEKRSLPLHHNFLLDASKYSEQLLQKSIPTLIVHGLHDEVIPIQASRNFALHRPWVTLIEFDSDHALSNVMAETWEAIKAFCQLLPSH